MPETIQYGVRLSADASSLVGGARQSQEAIKKIGDEAEKSAAIASKFGLALGSAAGAAAIAFGATVKSAISTAAALDDLSDSTGSAVEELSGLYNQMRVSGVDMGTFTTLTNRLAVGLSGLDEEGGKAAKALAALGVQSKDPATAMKELALQLDKYADGANKAALMSDIFGRGASQYAGVMKDIARDTEVAATVTTTFAAEAEKLQKELARARIETEALATAIAGPLVSAFAQLLEMKRTAGAAGIFAWLGLSNDDQQNVRDELDKTDAKIRALKETIVALSKDTVTNKINDIFYGDLGDLQKQLAVAQARYDALLKISNSQYSNDARTERPDAPKPPSAEHTAKVKKAADTWHEFAAAIKAAYDNALNWEIAGQEIAKRADELNKIIADSNTAMAVYVDAQNTAVDAYIAQTAAIGATRQELAALELQRQAEIRDVRLMAGWGDKATEIYERWASAIKDREVATSLREQADEVRRMSDSIRDDLTDAFMRAADGGKDAFKNLGNDLKRIFSNLVLRPIIQGAMAPIAGAVQGAAGGVVNGVLGGGTGGVGSSLGSMGQNYVGNYAYNVGSNVYGAYMAATTPAATTAAMGSIEVATSAYGGAAAEIVGGATLAADGTVTGAGIYAGLEAGLAAIPVAGWVALAALVIYGIVSGMEEGPAERKGVFANAAGSKGGNKLFASSSAFGDFGVVNDQWLSNDSGFVGAMTDILNSVKSVDNAVAKTIGKDNTALVSAALASQTTDVSFGMEDANLDQVRGMSASQILLARYKVVLNTLDAGLGNVLENFKGSGTDLANMITALASFSQAAKKFPTEIHDNLIKALDGTADSLTRVVKYANAFSTYTALAGQNRGDLVNTTILSQAAPGNYQFSGILRAVGAAADEFDGSADAAAALATGLTDLQSAAVSLIASFVAAKNDLHTMFADSIRGIQLDMLQSPGAKIDFLRNENTSLLGQLATATSPEEIRALGQRINQNYQTAWGMLSPDQQAAQGNEYISNLNATDQLVGKRIDALTTSVDNATDAMITKVGDMLTGAIDALGAAADVIANAADKIDTAADKMVDAAGTPVQAYVVDHLV